MSWLARKYESSHAFISRGLMANIYFSSTFLHLRWFSVQNKTEAIKKHVLL